MLVKYRSTSIYLKRDTGTDKWQKREWHTKMREALSLRNHEDLSLRYNKTIIGAENAYIYNETNTFKIVKDLKQKWNELIGKEFEFIELLANHMTQIQTSNVLCYKEFNDVIINIHEIHVNFMENLNIKINVGWDHDESVIVDFFNTFLSILTRDVCTEANLTLYQEFISCYSEFQSSGQLAKVFPNIPAQDIPFIYIVQHLMRYTLHMSHFLKEGFWNDAKYEYPIQKRTLFINMYKKVEDWVKRASAETQCSCKIRHKPPLVRSGASTSLRS